MPIYERAPEEIVDLVKSIAAQFHGSLIDAEVSVGVLLAEPSRDENGEPHGPAVKVRGHEALAAVRVVNYRDRVSGLPDVQIVLNHPRWQESSDDEQNAVIDHCLESLELKRDADAAIVRDDLGRPKLTIRHPERIVEWFDAVVRRFGSAAPEWQQFESVRAHTRQQRFEFDLPPTPDKPAKPKRAKAAV